MKIPIPTLHLFPTLDAKLIELLTSLKSEDWDKPTLAKLWTVKDIAAHLLDGNLRTLSIARDGYAGDPPTNIESYRDLVDYLNQLNASWVKAFKRISPTVLIELLKTSGAEYAAYLQSLDPFAPALFPVAWAGQQESPNWFHIAREYTEKWHHQQQIREATGKQGIMTRELYFPVLDTFMQALPHTYREMEAPKNSAVNVMVPGVLGGEWFLLMTEVGWSLKKTRVGNPVAEIMLDADLAWKLFTKAVTADIAEKKIGFRGDVAFREPIISMLAVMA